MNTRTRKWIEALGIKWSVEIKIAEVATAQILVDRIGQVHHITLPPRHKDAGGNKYFFETVHELIHAMLAEKLATIFASPPIDPALDEVPAGQRGLLVRLIFYFQELLDVWVSDIMHQHDPALNQDDNADWLRRIAAADRALLAQMYNGNKLELAIQYAIVAATISRSEQPLSKLLSKADSALQQIMSAGEWGMFQSMGNYLTRLPALSYNVAVAVQQLELAVNELATLAGYKLDLRIKYIDGDYRWGWEPVE